MSNLNEQIERSGVSIMRLARIAGVPARKLYFAEPLSPQEFERIEATLALVASGEIAPRKPRART